MKRRLFSALSLITLLSFFGSPTFAQSKGSGTTGQSSSLKSALSQQSSVAGESLSFKEAEAAVLKAAPFLQGSEHALERLERVNRFMTSDFVKEEEASSKMVSARVVASVDTDWSYSCAEGKRMDVYGQGIKGQTTSTINIPNASNINRIYAEVIYKGGNPGSSITIQGKTAQRTTPVGGSSDVYVYRAELSAASSVTYTNSSSTSNLQSLVLYVERNVVGFQSSGVFAKRSGYNDVQTINMSIPTSSSSRNLTINVPISEMTNDNRYLMIKATAGSSSTSKFIYSSDKSLGDCCLNIVTLELNNVPANVSSIAIQVDTRHNQNGQSGVNGQSWVLGSAIAINGECNPAPLSCVCLSNNLVLNPNFDSNANNWIAPQGQFSRYTGGPSGGYGILNNSNYDNDYTVYQDVALGENKYYKLTADAAKHGTSNNAYLRLEFYQGNTLISMSPDFNITKNFDGTLQSITPIEGYTPQGTNKVRIYGYARKTALKFDNVVLNTCYSEVIVNNTIKVKPQCGSSDGSIEIQASGGSGDYQYRINNGSYQTSNKFTGLGQGTYTIEVKDKNSTCKKTTSVALDCEDYCPYSITDPDPTSAEVNPSQVFDLSVKTDAPSSVYIEWVRSTQNVNSLDQLTTKTVVGGGYVANGGVTIQTTAPSSLGTYYYYACFKPEDPCGTFAKHIITVKNIGTNDPVCLSGERALTDNLLRGACATSSTYYSVWLDMSSSQGKPNYQHFRTTDLKFEEYCNGTAKIYGRAKADGGGNNDYIDVVYNLSNRTATTPSNSPKANSCTTYGNDLYYYTDAEGTIKGGSSGIYAGMEITISDNNSNSMPAFQLGTGANVNTNDFGASGWFSLNFTNSGSNGWSKKTDHGDFNFNLGGIVPFELEASASSQSVCLDGSVTFNAQFKGEVPQDCSLSYSWKSPDNVTVSSSQSFTISNVDENDAGVYTVTASFVSGGKVCSATATVNIIVDANCEGTPVCVPDCTPVALASWDLDNCNTGTGGNWYGEFTAKTNTGGCGEIEASTIYRVNPDVNKHSCASGISGDAMCINGINSTSKPGSGNDRAVRFATTITPSNGKSYKLSDLQFSYKRSGYQCNDGGSQSLVLYVFKNGTQVHEETITGLTKSWKTKTVSFAETEDFISDAATTYEFELIGFNPTGGCTVWEIDEVKLNGCCGNSVAKPIINVSSANICKGESVTLTASSCSGNLLWSTGATTEQIVVSPQSTTSYLVSCSLGSCAAEQSVEVTVDPNCNNDVCLTCQPKTVVKWNLNQCLALQEAYSYSEFLPEYPNSGNFTSVSATNVYRNNPSNNPHSCVVGYTGNANSDRAMCISASKSSSADWDKAIRFKATFDPSQTGGITKLRFNQKAEKTLDYAPEPSSSGGTASNNYPKKYSIRIYKEGNLVYESLNRSTNPTSWTTEEIDLSNDPDFEFSDETEFEFRMTAYSPVGNGADLSVWDLDNIEIVACNKSDVISATASNNGNICIGGDVTLTANSGTANLTYNWTGPNGFSATGSSVTTDEAGVYTVTVTSTNSCTATATTEVTFKAQPTVSVNNTTTCAGETATLTASGCNGNVSWNTGAIGNTLTINNPDATKEYTAMCTENGCTASASGVIYVQNCDENCIPPTDDNFEICEDELLTENVASNDLLPSDAFDIVYSLNSNVSNGTLNFSGNGEFVYTPTTGFSGIDNFVYKQVYKINDSIQGYSTDDAVLNGCGTNKIIDTYVKGLEGGGQSNSITIPNPSNLNNVIVEVWVENGSCANTMTIEGQTVTGQFVVRTNGQPDSEKIFRTTLSSVSADGKIDITAGNGSCQMSSVAAYVERDQIGGASSYLSSDTDLYHGYVSGGDDCVTVNIPIGGSSAPRDIDFKIPLHEVDDVRPVTVTITAGGVTQSKTSTSGLNGADLVSITLSNVPANTEIAEITVCSPDGNGDSFGIGAVSAAVEECTPPSKICEEVAQVEIIVHPKPEGSIPAIADACEGGNLTIQSGTWTNGATYSWVGPNSYSSNQQNPVISSITESTQGIYTLTVTSVENCTATATVMVNVVQCGSIGSTVWIDSDNDGIIDGNEDGISGVTVSLFDGSNNFIESVPTDSEGNYYFDELAPGQYQVKILGADLPTQYQYASETTIDTEEVDGNNNGSQVSGGQDISSQVVVLEPNGEPTANEELLGNSDNQIGGAQDDTNDSYGDMTVDFGLILNPKLNINKTFVSATDLGNNQFEVLYNIVVDNSGSAKTTYGLSDLPAFDNDINILEASYTSDAPGFSGTSLAGNGPWSLSTDVLLGGGLEHTYVLKVKAAINLTDGVTGDDTYKECGSGNSSTIAAGEGLFNVASLLDGNELVIDKDSACGDLPFITHSKTLSATTALGDNKYEVTYEIVVNNIGGASGTYGLKDDASFEDDINILDVSYTTTSGVPTVSLYPTDNVWTLANGVSLAAGGSHTYSVKVITQIDMTPGSSGNNVYEGCGSKTGGTEFEAGEGLFNESLLTDFEGTVIEKDTACGDLPYIVHSKVASNRTQIDRDDYAIEYTIEVENKGGKDGVYGLQDAPGFDSDVEIQSVAYTNNAGVAVNTLNIGDAVWTLSEDVSLAVGQKHTYILTVDVKLNLETGSSGDNVYNECSSSNGGDSFTKGNGLFNESILLDLNELEIARDTACIDLLAALGDTVFVDINGNGLQDVGEEGIPNVTVTLNGIVDGVAITPQTAATDANGFYEFIGLEPGDYTVTFPTSANIDGLTGQITADDATNGNTDGTDTNKDSDADQTTGITETYTLSYGEFEPRVDAGYYVPASLGDTVFVDVNGNGLQDAGEPGIEGVTVILTGTTGDGEPVSETTTTNGDGYYEFTGLVPGDYVVTFPTTADVDGLTGQLTDENANGEADDEGADDSDANETDGTTDTITLTSGEDEKDIDAGYYVPASLGDTVFVDTNGNGLQDAGEPGIEGVTVILTGTTGDG
ncbi:SdrD B-like domain-containing protein, partial [uncultured Arcticibacterium sp.]|uniref:SdrD B-like domain-containing protein n=1 Tax=uncultured Arcticibacterium sp. TaxID=2173042 RepID=UPI0030FD1A63